MREPGRPCSACIEGTTGSLVYSLLPWWSFGWKSSGSGLLKRSARSVLLLRLIALCSSFTEKRIRIFLFITHGGCATVFHQGGSRLLWLRARITAVQALIRIFLEPSRNSPTGTCPVKSPLSLSDNSQRTGKTPFRSWFDTSPRTETKRPAEAKSVHPEVSKGERTLEDSCLAASDRTFDP